HGKAPNESQKDRKTRPIQLFGVPGTDAVSPFGMFGCRAVLLDTVKQSRTPPWALSSRPPRGTTRTPWPTTGLSHGGLRPPFPFSRPPPFGGMIPSSPVAVHGSAEVALGVARACDASDFSEPPDAE